MKALEPRARELRELDETEETRLLEQATNMSLISLGETHRAGGSHINPSHRRPLRDGCVTIVAEDGPAMIKATDRETDGVTSCSSRKSVSASNY